MLEKSSQNPMPPCSVTLPRFHHQKAQPTQNPTTSKLPQNQISISPSLALSDYNLKSRPDLPYTLKSQKKKLNPKKKLLSPYFFLL